MTRFALTLLFSAAAVFGADEFPTAAGSVAFTPIQHASLMFTAGGKTVYVDPVQGNYDGRPKADYILITDIHGDHMSAPTVDRLRKPSTEILAPAAVAEKIQGATVISNGQTKTMGPFEVQAIPMYNMKRGPSAGQLYHPKGRGNGYVVSYGGKRFYFSGDTEATPEMKALRNIDVAFVCMNLPFTMTPEEAAEAVKAFHPAVVYPYHYRGSDVNAFAKALAGTGIDVRLRDWYPK
ncbi:MAG TPA: MBL fold metallo-hydrolase [Bryobacteraceae bacterium]|nr:MBL fold metallo-hydrolase [Bryobacteraceae bacterium]